MTSEYDAARTRRRELIETIVKAADEIGEIDRSLPNAGDETPARWLLADYSDCNIFHVLFTFKQSRCST